MKISYNWLKNYIRLSHTPEEVAEKLTLAGLEVEEIETVGSDFEGFVVGKVLDVKSHPNADKLQLCEVDNGEEDVQIVCGAKNVAAGQKVPVAKVGATIPVPLKDGSFLTIKKMKLRGEISEGMICSEAELGLSDDHSGIMVLNENFDTGLPLNEALETTKDTIFEIGLTPNRPDAACHVGTARDLSAVLDETLNNPYEKINPASNKLSDDLEISIEDEEKCHRYVGIVVDDVNVTESPAWLKNSLKSIGLRPINNIVDVTNYVLHEIGQPLHAFDYHLVRDKKIVVKSFDEDLSFTTLDSVDRQVPKGSLFICDGVGPVAIAGVMGGENSEVNDSTRKILIESAYFNPSSIRKTSKSLALQTDSSYRFERGIDPELQLKAAYRAAQLIADLSGGTIIDGHLDIHPVKKKQTHLNLRISRLNHLLGTDISSDEAEQILTRLEFEVTKNNQDVLSCTVPSFRPDVTREVDLIEEVGRIFDYNNIPTPDSAPFVTPEPLTTEETFYQRLKSIATSLRYKEISTNSLLSKNEANLLAEQSVQIDTLNPVSQDNTTLRTHLTAGFLKSVSYNLNRNKTHLRFFELGHVFRKSDRGTWIEGIEEHVHLLLGITGNKEKTDWQGTPEKYSVFDLKSDVEAIWKSLGIINGVETKINGNQSLSYFYKDLEICQLIRQPEDVLKSFDAGQEAFIAEIDVTHLLRSGAGEIESSYTPVAKFPVFEFDAAFNVDRSVRAGEITKIIKDTAGDILKSASVFDIYEDEKLGENKKSIAFRFTFLDSNKTLNIKDVEPIVQKIVQSVEKQTGAKLRS